MSLFDPWHSIIALIPVAAIILVVWLVIHPTRRKSGARQAPQTPAVPSSHHEESAPPDGELRAQAPGKLVAWYYILFGAIGLIMSVPAIERSGRSAAQAFATLLLLAQLGAAVWGGVEVLRRRSRGYQLLYWVSVSCIPAVASSLITYYSAIGVGLLPNLSFGAGYSGTGFMFKFGYASLLTAFPGTNVTTLGVNLVAIGLTLRLRSLLKRHGVRAWPIRRSPA